MKPFYRVHEAAEILGMHPQTLTNAIEQGQFPALVMSGDHRSTRIRHTDLFPDEAVTRDLKIERIRRQVADVLRKQEANERIFAAVLDRQAELRESIATLADELAMQDVDAAREALKKAS